MLGQAERLRKSGLIQRVYTARKSVSTELISLYVLPRQAKSSPRLPLTAFVAGKKTLSKASDRNRAKRRLREAYKAVKSGSGLKDADDMSDCIQLKQWYAMVFVVQSGVLNGDFKDIVKSVRLCLEKANQKFGVKRASSKGL